MTKRPRGYDGPTLRLALRAGSRFRDAMADDGVDERPLDAAVEEAPGVVRLQRKLHRARELVARQVSDRRLWIAQQDLESAYRSVREDLYFDVGYTFGLVAGRSEPRMSRAAHHLAKELRTVALMAQLRPADVVAALQETTRAILDLSATTRT